MQYCIKIILLLLSFSSIQVYSHSSTILIFAIWDDVIV